MNVRSFARVVCTSVLLAVSVAMTLPPAVAAAEGQQRVRVSGVVRDEANAITLPGLPVEVVGTDRPSTPTSTAATCSTWRRAPTSSRSRWTAIRSGTIKVDRWPERTVTVDVGLTMSEFAETVTVTADADRCR